jgi:4-diphosphocytidyl-2-C-methyl-D-erythritol kinase
MAIEAFAPAKINLTLHVTGQRGDGYHLLDSLVVFLDVGDRVLAAPAPDLSMRVTGLNAAGVPPGDDNLVMRAARLVAGADIGLGATLVLDKHLPTASGIGGGSSDAAAAMRAVSRLWARPLPAPAAVLRLGADVPACLAARSLRMRGIGDELRPVVDLPPFALVLANPRVETPTAGVFSALARKDNAPMPDTLPPMHDADALAEFLRGQRNDLERPARALCPQIDDVLAAMAVLPGCFLARMSGSGATCFGLFADRAEARVAALALGAAHPSWWVAAGAPHTLAD